MLKSPQRKNAQRRILGISLASEMAGSVKAEAARRGISLKKLFEEMWVNYMKKPGSPKEK